MSEEQIRSTSDKELSARHYYLMGQRIDQTGQSDGPSCMVGHWADSELNMIEDEWARRERLVRS